MVGVCIQGGACPYNELLHTHTCSQAEATWRLYELVSIYLLYVPANRQNQQDPVITDLAGMNTSREARVKGGKKGGKVAAEICMYNHLDDCVACRHVQWVVRTHAIKFLTTMHQADTSQAHQDPGGLSIPAAI